MVKIEIPQAAFSDEHLGGAVSSTHGNQFRYIFLGFSEWITGEDSLGSSRSYDDDWHLEGHTLPSN